MTTELTKRQEEAMLLARQKAMVDARDNPFTAFRLGFEAALEYSRPELEAYVAYISGEINEDELDKRLQR